MELEKYNEKKALALQKLNDINLLMFQTETISRAFTFDFNSLILTGKRVICVHESRKHNAAGGGGNYENRRTKKVFKSWNILYKDIMKMQLIMKNRERKQQMTVEEMDQLIEENKTN